MTDAQINALVAEKVMGLSLWLNEVGNFDPDTGRIFPRKYPPVLGIRVPVGAKGNPYPCDQWHPLPDYCTLWSDARQIVEKMSELGWGMVHWNHWPASSVGYGHNVAFYQSVYPPAFGQIPSQKGNRGQSFPLACCLAALYALKVDVPL